MNSNRSWNILNWNIRGINTQDKWLAIRQKVEESAAGILCLQETKRENFDLAYINKFCPRRFNKFEFLPSIGASEGILIAWNEGLFKGELMFLTDSLYLLSLPATALPKHGFSQTFMAPVNKLTK